MSDNKEQKALHELANLFDIKYFEKKKEEKEKLKIFESLLKTEIETTKKSIEQMTEEVKEEIPTPVIEESKNTVTVEIPSPEDQVAKIADYIASQKKVNEAMYPTPIPQGNKDLADALKKISHLEHWVSRIAASGPGSGEVNLRYLDDVDTSNLINGHVLSYNSTYNNFEFVAQSGGESGSTISTATVNESGNLIITLTDATEVDAGYVVGAQGNTGATGETGSTGADGISAGLRFIYNSGSGYQDPGDGKFSVNRDSTPTFASTTRLIFSYQSADAIAVNTLISKWDDNTTQTNRGVVMISKADGTQQSWWYITGTYATAGTGFWNHTPATFLGGSTAFTNGEEYFVTFVRNGDKGDTGANGADGTNGVDGANGVSVSTATVNESGNLVITLTDTSNVDAGYVVGPQGEQGIQGETGATGPQGEQGIQGETGATGQGVAAGGTTGQILTKVDGTDYNTQWSDPANLPFVAYAKDADQDLSSAAVITFPTSSQLSAGDSFGSMAATGIFTFTKTGNYLVTISYNISAYQNSSSAPDLDIWGKVNDSNSPRYTQIRSTGIFKGSISEVVPITNTNDTFRWFSNNTGGNITVYGTGDTKTRISIVKLN